MTTRQRHGLWLLAVSATALAGCDFSENEPPDVDPTVADAEADSTPNFRGIGQEPGWFLEIYDDMIAYEPDYGQRRITVRRPEPEEIEGGRRYVTETLTVEIRDRDCFDAMNGSYYPAEVQVTEDGGETLSGCGRPL